MPSIITTLSKVLKAYDENICLPETRDIFQAYEDLTPDQVRVVIIGQDPYAAPIGQAIGRAFACGITMSPSLESINTALEWYGLNPITPKTMNLEHWVEQGVFLLNSSLTVQHEKPGSHADIGWDVLIKETIRILCTRHYPIAWLLWGRHADQFRSLITNTRHLVLKAEHPVAAARAGRLWKCDHFVKANNYFKEHNYPTIIW